MEGPIVAPWQEDVEHPREAWVFVSPVVGSERRSVLEHLEHGPGTRATYHGPRHPRDLWAQARAAVAAQVLLATEGPDPAKVRAELARDPDPLRGYLAGVVYSGLRRQNRESRSWPKASSPSLRARLEQHYHAMGGEKLHGHFRPWRADLPARGTPWHEVHGYATRSAVAVALPRWWFWRHRWPGLHPILREAQPLRLPEGSDPKRMGLPGLPESGVFPVHVATRRVTAHTRRFRLGVSCHVVLAWHALPYTLQVWLVRHDGEHWVVDLPATMEWRKTLDPKKLDAARHDWEKLDDLC